MPTPGGAPADFSPQPFTAGAQVELLRKLVRARVDDLIVREYMERDRNDMNTLRYVP